MCVCVRERERERERGEEEGDNSRYDSLKKRQNPKKKGGGEMKERCGLP